jgi:hypothetical protein
MASFDASEPEKVDDSAERRPESPKAEAADTDDASTTAESAELSDEQLEDVAGGISGPINGLGQYTSTPY